MATRPSTRLYSIAPLGPVLLGVAVFNPLVIDWVAGAFTYVVNGLLGFVGTLIGHGVKPFLFFDSPYRDPAMNSAFTHNLDIFPQLLAVVFMAGIASKPFADEAEAADIMLVWKVLKVIIFIRVNLRNVVPLCPRSRHTSP